MNCGGTLAGNLLQSIVCIMGEVGAGVPLLLGADVGSLPLLLFGAVLDVPLSLPQGITSVCPTTI